MFGEIAGSCGNKSLGNGNLVFNGGDRRDGVAAERLLEEQAAKRLALEADFFVRTAKEWDAIVAGNPFRREAKTDPGHLVLMCLKAEPDMAAARLLQATIVGPEVVHAAGRHLYVTFPNGIGTSRLTTALIEQKLGTRGTCRNWNTVLKLQVLAAGAQ